MENYVAIGDLVLDIYHNNINNEFGYYIGGSPWNDLLNISALNSNANCYCIATCGNDWAGDFLISELSKNSIDTTNVIRLNRQTNRINIIVDSGFTKSQLECPFCKKKMWYSDTSLPQNMPDQFQKISPGIVIVNNIRRCVLQLADSFKKNGWFLATDIGYISNLRYMSKEEIIASLCNKFEIIQMPNKVFKFLLRKLACSCAEELYSVLNCIYLSITDGANGAVLLYKNQLKTIEKIEKQARTVSTIDPTGAGDAYFSMLLNQLNEKLLFPMGIENAIENATIYAAERVSVVGAHGVYKTLERAKEDCERCGIEQKQKNKKKSPRQRIETNVKYLLNRTLDSLESGASEKIKKILSSCNGTILMVGTGGSYTAACFAANCVSQFHPHAFARACYPRDLIIQGVNKIDLVFLFSYSGKTNDIQNAYNYCKNCGVKAFVITQTDFSNNNPYEDDLVISYGTKRTTTKERGFISMAGTLIPMCLFGKVFFNDPDCCFEDYIINCFNYRMQEYSLARIDYVLPSERLIIDIFSGFDTVCAAIDLESKFIESGLARVNIHEKKDFSHGRFNIVSKYEPHLMIILDNICGAYSTKLNQYLEKNGNSYICHMTTRHGVIWGDLDLIIGAEFFSQYMSNILQYDMAQPGFPRAAMSLYKYADKDIL